MMSSQSAISVILDHYDNPRHYGVLEPATFSSEAVNPGCGDVVTLYLKLDADDIITGVAFEGRGCTVSQASVSILTEMIEGKSLDEALSLDEEDLAETLGMQIIAGRLPCAMLGLRALKSGAEKYRNTL